MFVFGGLHCLIHAKVLANHSSLLQIGFLAEWQGYAQQLKGDNWRDAKMDQEKISKMSGMCACPIKLLETVLTW